MPATSQSEGHALRDYLKPYLRLLGAWDRKSFFSLARGILQSRSSILSCSARSRLTTCAGLSGRVDDWVKRSSALLASLPWADFWNLHAKRLRHRQSSWSLIVHDGSDIAKPYAKKMEGLSKVHDGSSGEIVNGYTFCSSIGVGPGAWDIHPIVATLIDPSAEDFCSQGRSFHDHMLKIIAAGIGQDSLHVFDRGFDDEKYLSFFREQQLSFLLRVKDNRIVSFRGEQHAISAVAATLISEGTTLRRSMTKEEERKVLGGEQRAWDTGSGAFGQGMGITDEGIYGFAPVGVPITHDSMGAKIPTEIASLTLIAIARPTFTNPMLLLTNVLVEHIRQAVISYHLYLKRWEVETSLRLLKQTLQTEQMQLMTSKRLQGLLALEMLLMDFLLQRYRAEQRKSYTSIAGAHRGEWDTVLAQDTRIFSPYLLSEVISTALQHEQRHTSEPDLIPDHSFQPALFQTVDTF